MNTASTDFSVPEQFRSLAMVHSRAVHGVAAVPVTVEVHLANGLPSFSTVGMPETAVRESKDRVRGAILNSGFEFPAKRITVNLAPADLPKSSGRFDLPIAIGILVASGQLPNVVLSNLEMIGELALDGRLRKVAGVLPTAMACGQARRQLILPVDNKVEASLAEATESYAGDHLLSICAHLVGQTRLSRCTAEPSDVEPADVYPDISDVKGQPQAKRALEIAAAGNHSVIFVGPPGTGKSMLATRLPSLLPNLNTQDALAAATIQSVANGEFDAKQWRIRPYRAPHHSASSAALVGGGSTPKPGEISRAHHGVLFLDELTEFSRATLEQLREPLETGEIHIARAAHSVSFPARFLLVAACNPCRCGFLGDNTDRCQCSAASIEQYRSKLSGPMLDRIDMHLHLNRVDIKTLQQSNSVQAESSDVVRERVSQVRCIQLKRQKQLNSRLSAADIDRYCPLDRDCSVFLERVCERLHLSARAYHRILKLARTIADMEGESSIGQAHLAEAVGYRSLDRR